MDKEQLKERARVFFREQLSLIDYIDVKAADANIRKNIVFRGPNVYILFVAIVIASVGLNVNSIPVIIGAMLISPLMSPIIGFGLGLGTNDTDLLLQSLKNLGIMFVISLLASTLYFLATPLETDNPTELLARTNPSIYDVLIAFFGGVAGILELSRKEKGTVLSGVAIATALMPPLCTVGYGIANWNWAYASGALYLFFINCIFIALATYIAVKYLNFPKVADSEGKSYKRLITSVLLILVVLVPSFFSAYNIVRENRFFIASRHFVKENQSIRGTYIYDYTTDISEKPYKIVLRLAGETLSNESRAEFYTRAEQYGITHNQIVFEEDATIEVRRLNETEILKDWIATNEQQLRQREDSIRSLRAQLNNYEALLLPSEQIAAELRSQWPSISNIALTRGANMPTDQATQEVILVVLQSQPLLNSGDLTRIQNWLSVRLQNEHVLVIQQD